MVENIRKFSDLYKINALKRAYEHVTNELNYLSSLDWLTESNVEKRKAIPKWKAIQAEIEAEFEDTVQSVKAWCATLPPHEKVYANLIMLHYCDIKKPQSYSDVYRSIKKMGFGISPSNAKSKILKLWLDSFK